MTILFIILVVLASFLLGFVVLVQNPKGGGLSGSIGGISTQYMGVKQTTDVLEKGTWIFGGLIALLCLVSVVFMPRNVSTGVEDRLNQATGTGIPAPKPAATNPTPVPAPAPAPATTPAPAGN